MMIQTTLRFLFSVLICIGSPVDASYMRGDDRFLQNSLGYSEQGDRRMRATRPSENGLIVRVIDSTGKQPLQSQSEAMSVAFGSTNSAAQQFNDCSGGDFTFVPYRSGSINGVVNVRLDAPITTYSKGDARVAAQEKLCILLSGGGSCDGSKMNAVDHIMYILPGGTNNCHESGCLFAAVNGQYSVFGDSTRYSKPAFSVEGILHELSHNFKVGHAREDGSEYGDDTGMMGASYYLWGANNSDKRCFNGYNMYEMGWQKQRQADIPVGTSCTLDMIGIADLSRSSNSNQYLVVKYGEDYFVNFNRKTGFNSQTREYGDQTLVVKRGVNSPGSDYYDTDLFGKLNVGQSFQQDGLTVRACSSSVVNGAQVVTVAVGSGASCSDRPCFASSTPATSAPTPSPTRSPTPAPTPSPTRQPTPSPTPQATSRPTPSPTPAPTPSPTRQPTPSPTPQATSSPTPAPTPEPTRQPTPAPTPSPTDRPTPGPTPSPTRSPTPAPTSSPTPSPTANPTAAPTPSPTFSQADITAFNNEVLGSWAEKRAEANTATKDTMRSYINTLMLGDFANRKLRGQ